MAAKSATADVLFCFVSTSTQVCALLAPYLVILLQICAIIELAIAFYTVSCAASQQICMCKYFVLKLMCVFKTLFCCFEDKRHFCSSRVSERQSFPSWVATKHSALDSLCKDRVAFVSGNFWWTSQGGNIHVKVQNVEKAEKQGHIFVQPVWMFHK